MRKRIRPDACDRLRPHAGSPQLISPSQLIGRTRGLIQAHPGLAGGTTVSGMLFRSHERSMDYPEGIRK
jgi:hypothetical protein